MEKHVDEIARGVDMRQIELIRGVDKKHKIRFIWVVQLQNHAIIPMSKCLRTALDSANTAGVNLVEEVSFAIA